MPFSAILLNRYGGGAMGFYDSPESVEQYVEMAKGYDGRELIEKMRRYLQTGSTVLEIGMGPGVDLDLLHTYFDAIGSDASEVFIQRYLATHPDASVLKLDAVTLDTDRRFDGVFSNKVLHHLKPTDQAASFQRQAVILNPGGYAFHSFWYGNEVEEFEGLLSYQHTENSLQSLVEPFFEVVELLRYTEMEPDDSLFAILKRR
jgi:SAM-dependent methyltransferase